MSGTQRRRARAAIAALAVCLLASAAAGRPVPQPGAHADTAPPDRGVLLAGSVEVARLLDLCAARLGIALEYDAALVRGQVTLRIEEAVGNRALWELTNQALAAREFTTVLQPGSQTYSVVRLTDAAARARIEPGVQVVGHRDAPAASPREDAPLAPGYTARLVALRHRTAKESIEIARAVLSKSHAQAVAFPDSRLVLLSDLTPRIEEVVRVLEEFDQPAHAVVHEEIAAQHLEPAVLAAAVMALAGKRDAVGGGPRLAGEVMPSLSSTGVMIVAPAERVQQWRDMIASLDKPGDLVTRPYTPSRFAVDKVASLLEQVLSPAGKGMIVRDELTGTLLITGTPVQHARIAEVITRLDAAAGEPLRPMRTFAVRNRPVAEVLGTLQALIDAGALEATLAGGTGAAPDRDLVRAAASPTMVREGAPGSLTSSPPLPSPPSPAQADTQNTTQVRLNRGSEGDKSMLSLTADEATNTLIAVGEPRLLRQLEMILRTLDVRQPQVMVEVLLVSLSDSDALQLGVELQKIDSIGDTALRLSSLFGLGTGVGAVIPGGGVGGTVAVFNPGEFSVLVRAVQNINRGRSVSMPRVLVNNNQPANFSSTLQQPFATSNATNTSTVISYGGSESAGTTISVTPQISEGDHLVLTYKLSLSSFVGAPSSTGLPPPRQENSVDSVATVPDGYTVGVGGLELLTESEATTQVPLLGNIPLIGELFKQRNLNEGRTRFYVFIRANVMRHERLEDLKYASDRAAAEAEVPTDLPMNRPQLMR